VFIVDALVKLQCDLCSASRTRAIHTDANACAKEAITTFKGRALGLPMIAKI
jgi:hypothetical protein